MADEDPYVSVPYDEFSDYIVRTNCPGSNRITSQFTVRSWNKISHSLIPTSGKVKQNGFRGTNRIDVMKHICFTHSGFENVSFFREKQTQYFFGTMAQSPLYYGKRIHCYKYESTGDSFTVPSHYHYSCFKVLTRISKAFRLPNVILKTPMGPWTSYKNSCKRIRMTFVLRKPHASIIFKKTNLETLIGKRYMSCWTYPFLNINGNRDHNITNHTTFTPEVERSVLNLLCRTYPIRDDYAVTKYKYCDIRLIDLDTIRKTTARDCNFVFNIPIDMDRTGRIHCNNPTSSVGPMLVVRTCVLRRISKAFTVRAMRCPIILTTPAVLLPTGRVWGGTGYLLGRQFSSGRTFGGPFSTFF